MCTPWKHAVAMRLPIDAVADQVEEALLLRGNKRVVVGLVLVAPHLLTVLVATPAGTAMGKEATRAILTGQIALENFPGKNLVMYVLETCDKLTTEFVLLAGMTVAILNRNIQVVVLGMG